MPDIIFSDKQPRKDAGFDRVRAAFESGLKHRQNLPRDPREELTRYDSEVVDFNDKSVKNVLRWWKVFCQLHIFFTCLHPIINVEQWPSVPNSFQDCSRLPCDSGILNSL